MCKVLIITGITEGVMAETFAKYMAVPMSRSNSDGLGYAAVDAEGKLFSERWRYNFMSFSTEQVMVPSIAKKLEGFKNRLPLGSLDTNYARFGDGQQLRDAKSLTMHTRMATCEKSLANVHPFIYEDASLIHNGVIRNADVLKVNKISTCDSEAALQTYLADNIRSNPSGAKDWLDKLTGGYVFGILARDSADKRILDVVRGTSMLYYMEIEGVGKVYTTDKSDAEAVVKELGYTFIKEPYFVAGDSMLRYDALTGDLMEEIDIKPKVKEYSRGSYNQNDWRSSSRSWNNTTRTPTFNGKRVLELSKPQQLLMEAISMLGDTDDMNVNIFPIFNVASTKNKVSVDYSKFNLYVNNRDYKFEERLDVWDIVMPSSDLKTQFLSFDIPTQVSIMNVDKEKGFKQAREFIIDLHKRRTSNVG